MTEKIIKLENNSKIIRATAIKMAVDAKESHLSSALSCTDILNVLFAEHLEFPNGGLNANPDRNRFIMSKGHACSSLYAVMALYGVIPVSMLKTYATTDSPLPNHPCKHALPKLEISSGSLGHGLGIAAGMLYGLRMDGKYKPRVFVLMSDGECNEGSVWEAAMFAAANKLGNLIAIVDNNGTQAVGRCDELMGHTCLEEKFKSFGWEAVTISGNSTGKLLDTLDSMPLSKTKPSAIIAKTVAGAGVSFIENKQEWFYRTPTRADLDAAVNELGVEPLNT